MVSTTGPCIAKGCSSPAMRAMLLCRQHINADGIGRAPAPVAAPVAPANEWADAPTAVRPIECSLCDVGYLPHYSEPLPESLVTLCRVFRLCAECYESPNTEHSAMCPDYLAGRGECTCCPGCFVSERAELAGEHTCSMRDSEPNTCIHLTPTVGHPGQPCHSGPCPSSEYPGGWLCCGGGDDDECPTCPSCAGDLAPPLQWGDLCHACQRLSDAYASSEPPTAMGRALLAGSPVQHDSSARCTLPHCTCVGGL